MKLTVIRLDLLLQQPWAIGSSDTYGDIDQEIQQQVLKDIDGDPIVPGSSLVGSLRDHLGDAAEKWLGRESGIDAANDPPTPSPLRCLAPVVSGAGTTTVMRTSIDPVRRAAKARGLRSEELVESAATVTWWLVWEPITHSDSDRDELIEAFTTFHPIIGRGRTSGRGRAVTTKVHWRDVDLSQPDDLTWWLADRHEIMAPQAGAPHGQPWEMETVPAPDLAGARWDVVFRCADPLFLGPGETSGERPNRVTSGKVVATTTWKGIFRHRVEHILTVTDAPDRPAIIERLFGSPRGSDPDEGKRGRLYFEASEVVGDLQRSEGVTKVAIDRVSGGAYFDSHNDPLQAAGALFAIRAYEPGSTVRLRIIEAGPLEDSDRRLIDLVIDDINDGLVAVGAYGTRGFGTLRRASA